MVRDYTVEKPRAGFSLPPVTETSDGRPRMVGFELEFSGLTLEQTVDALGASLGGEPATKSAAECTVQVDSLGEFNIELDWDFLKRLAAEKAERDEGAEWVDTLSQVAAMVVPVEVVCPPIPVTGLESLQPMVAALREAGAVGTEESLLAAYGVHINAEIPCLDAATLSAYLKAFAVLQWWLVEAHAVDPTRKISPYVDLYPQAYVKLLLSRSAPTMDQIFDDYLKHNASRNRALDMLPMLAQIDEDRVRQAVDDPKIKARPTFHYRLPNCHIEQPDWSLTGPWNVWQIVERLAYRPDALAELGAEFRDAEWPVLGVQRSGWVEHVDRWLKDRALA